MSAPSSSSFTGLVGERPHSPSQALAPTLWTRFSRARNAEYRTGLLCATGVGRRCHRFSSCARLCSGALSSGSSPCTRTPRHRSCVLPDMYAYLTMEPLDPTTVYFQTLTSTFSLEIRRQAPPRSSSDGMEVSGSRLGRPSYRRSPRQTTYHHNIEQKWPLEPCQHPRETSSARFYTCRTWCVRRFHLQALCDSDTASLETTSQAIRRPKGLQNGAGMCLTVGSFMSPGSAHRGDGQVARQTLTL